jgi:hypothetical protein
MFHPSNHPLSTGLADFIHTFKPQWDSWADAAAHNVVSWLGPFDHTLLRIYTVVAVLAGARVLIKWKTIALEFILHHRASLADESSRGRWPGDARKPHIKSSGVMRSGSSKSVGVKQPAAAAMAAAPAARAAAAAAEDDFDEAGVMQREGSMLSVSMRPRSVQPAAMAAAESSSSAAAAAGREGAAGGSSAAAVGGWGGSSAAVAADVPWPAQGGREGDSIERLLLPLDRWVPRPAACVSLQHKCLCYLAGNSQVTWFVGVCWQVSAKTPCKPG